jgi:Xaa-Pro dipeptidase
MYTRARVYIGPNPPPARGQPNPAGEASIDVLLVESVNSVSWPRDDAKLARVRELMTEQDLDVLVVRAPDNVLYLTNFWSMKGYDACVFPREGEPILICIEASAEDAERSAWATDVRLIRGYAADDPRPVPARTLEAALVAVPTGRVGLELSLGTQASDRMVGEPTTYTKSWFDAFPDAVDATQLLGSARMLKTGQEIVRMRIANEIAAQAMHHVRRRLEPGMKESEAAAIWQGYVHGEGTARDDVDLALPFSLVWSGRGIKTFTATGDLPVVEGEPVLFEIWVCADGYWADHTKNLVVGELKPEYAEFEEGLLSVYNQAIEDCAPGRSMPDLDRSVRDGLARIGYPGQPSHPICHGIGARAHEPPYPHQAGSGTFEENMVLAIEPGAYWDGGGGLRVEDNFLVTADGLQKLSAFPDGVVRC